MFALLYGDLKRLAHSSLQRNMRSGELNTTALVHESFLKLSARGRIAVTERPAFFACVGKVMRSVVLDAARERRARKRGRGEAAIHLPPGWLA